MGKALYRKYRSRTLDEIVGQPHVVAILRRSLDTDTIGHAYLLTGIRGVGKTSIARILAHEINQLPYDEDTAHLDIVEIDAASNSSVEDIRDLREKSMIAPASAAKKIYIIDEVHMLSKSAFNALLKTLEEPPAHVVFILATTDVHKLPATILSRVQRFNLRPISTDDLASHLSTIAEQENIAIDDDALRLIALYGNGSFRDAISLLDQVRNVAEGQISSQEIEASLGLIESAKINQLFDYYATGNAAAIIQLVREAERSGLPATSLIDQLLTEGRQRAYTDPTLLPLLDELVEARRSEWPDIKLLAALISSPSDNSTVPVQPSLAPQPSPKPLKKTSPQKSSAETTPAPVESPQPKSSEAPIGAPGKSVDFAWVTFTESVRGESMGAFSVLSRCDYIFDGEKLHIYCGKAFPKKQLEKALPALSSSLQGMGHDHAVIELIAATKPNDNQDLAAALAIMGGGEEVAVNG